MNRHTVIWSEAILAGSVIFLAYALISTRRWIDREHGEHQKGWIVATR